MSSIDGLAGNAGEWLTGIGPDSDIVISCRARLARNVAGYPFVIRADTAMRAELEEQLKDAVMAVDIGEPLRYFPLIEAPALDRLLLLERHMISREMLEGDGPRGLAFTDSESMGIMINEEDHLRIQAILSGLQLSEALEAANRMDDQIDGRVEYACSSDLGYLSACPSNVGTGLRVSVMLHLPALAMTKEIEKVFQAVSRINLAVRGLYGEGTQATGEFYQISNQRTLGRSEDEIVENVRAVIPQIVRYERLARSRLMTNERSTLEDRVWRAYGLLRNARVISSQETLMLLSSVRLGINLALIEVPPLAVLNELFVLTQPAHLQKIAGRELEPPERDQFRAELIRSRLA